MNNHFNELEPDEAERLAILLEECGEIQQIIGKILRHGKYSWNPNDKDKQSNKKLLAKEVGDMQFIVDLMIENNDISIGEVLNQKDKKRISIKKYLHHN